MIDSHCHLADPAFSADLTDVIERAQAAGVQRALCILSAGDPEESAAARNARELWADLRVAVGVHPHHAGAFAGRPEEAAQFVIAAAKAEGASAVGEIGLDYHYQYSAPEVQRGVFEAQVAAAGELALPIVIHTREATDDTFGILRSALPRSAGGVFHCFTGDVAMARLALDIGFYVSLAGIVTFPRSAALRDVAAFVPADRLLVETDAPYLAPVPHRGKRNEPAFVAGVLEQVAGLRGVAAGVLGAQLVRNFDALFGPTGTHIEA
jgi:TatD DNase family protein